MMSLIHIERPGGMPWHDALRSNRQALPVPVFSSGVAHSEDNILLLEELRAFNNRGYGQ